MQISQQQLLSFFLCASVIVAQGQVDPVGEVGPPVCDHTECAKEGGFCSGGSCIQQGTCLTKYDCFSPHNLVSTTECVGHMDCLDGICGMDCTGVENSCPNNQVSIDFEIYPPSLPDGTTGLPCEIRNCYDSDWCYNESCGFEKAVFLSSSGNQVCNSCTSDDGCESNEYCSIGSCTPSGNCNARADCMNPANTVVSASTCSGFVGCFTGDCQVFCKESGCPGDLKKVPYTAKTDPCKKKSLNRLCSQAVSCVVDDCGYLSAIFYDGSGNVVCSDASSVSSSFLTTGGILMAAVLMLVAAI